MTDRITLLPDHIANQIAAGEVIQRPASAVKELLENAVDAGATEIKLIIVDAGKTLLQVGDNGSGMSDTDARMSFERHATSKIKSIDDLFHIRTMGFRGEALASIAAVAQVELKSKKADVEMGTYIEIENSIVQKQEPIAVPNGTSIAMKNLFFNVPARRNFLKSNASEMRHIVDEFTRVAMSFPHIHFSLTSNGQQMFYLEKGTLKQRIVQLLGNTYNNKLVTVKDDTDYFTISGFVGKPETAKKTRGDQYFFVNNRFIKSPYLHHAVMNAYQSIIPAETIPMYVLFIDLDPTQVDVNVHPTKQEIKFEDEKIIYAFVQAAVKHALAQFSVMPSLDFELDASIQHLDAVSKPFTDNQKEITSKGNIYQGFTQAHQAHKIEGGQTGSFQGWQEFYKPVTHTNDTLAPLPAQEISLPKVELPFAIEKMIGLEDDLLQILNTYILVPTQEGFLLVHQQLAHERVLYNQMQTAMEGSAIAIQQLMFPTQLELVPADAVLLESLLEEFKTLGFLIELLGNNTFSIQGVPGDFEDGNEKQIIDFTLEQYKYFNTEIKISNREKLIRSLAKQRAVKTGYRLTQREIKHLIQDLFATTPNNTTPNGTPVYLAFKQNQLEKMFGFI